MPVRPAAPSDISALVEMMSEFYAEGDLVLSPATATRSFELLLGDPKLGMVWLLQWESEAVGFLVMTLNFSMEFGGQRGVVDDFFVRKPFRGRGLGAAALDEMRRFCLERDVRALLVEVDQANDPVQRFYGRGGFRKTASSWMKLPLACPAHVVNPKVTEFHSP